MLLHPFLQPLRCFDNVPVPTITGKQVYDIADLFSWQNVLSVGVKHLPGGKTACRLTHWDRTLRDTENTPLERHGHFA